MKPRPTFDPFDYDDYSLEELRDARLHVDASRHSARARELDERIAAKERLLAENPDLAASPSAPLWPLAAVGILIVAIAGIVAAVKVPKILAEGRSLAGVVTALEAAYPGSSPVEASVVAGGDGPGGGPRAKAKGGQKGEGGTKGVTVLLVKVVAPDRVDQAFEAKREHAREIAAAAFSAFDDPDRLTTVGVHFLRAAGEDAGPGARFAFPAKEFRETDEPREGERDGAGTPREDTPGGTSG